MNFQGLEKEAVGAPSPVAWEREWAPMEHERHNDTSPVSAQWSPIPEEGIKPPEDGTQGKPYWLELWEVLADLQALPKATSAG